MSAHPAPGTEAEVALLHQALHLAASAYHGHNDRYGRPKLLHVIRVSQQLAQVREQIAAVLHDLPEDFPDTHGLPPLQALGFPTDILAIVDCLTRRDNKQEPWDDYIGRIRQNRGAIRVKLADLNDNLNLLRIHQLTPQDLDRYNRYLSAWRSLQAALSV